MPCDHGRTRPLIRNGEQLRQYGARMADCITCPPDRPSTLLHPDDAHLIDAHLEREEAASRG